MIIWMLIKRWRRRRAERAQQTDAAAKTPPARPAPGFVPAAYGSRLDESAAISVRGLHKSYGDSEAVRGVDFDVGRGEIVAFLGPNGAGKTTTVEMLEGYRARSAGDVRVLGEAPSRSSNS